MTINKLLGAVAVAALIAGAAQAQTVTLDGSGSSAQLPEQDAAFVVGEFQPAAAVDQLAGSLVIVPEFGAAAAFGAIPVDHRVTGTFTLTNATFTTPVGGTNTAGTGACDFVVGAQSGGGTGQTSVSFISAVSGTPGAGDDFNTCAAAASDAVFTFPIIRTSSASPITVTAVFTQVDAAGAAVATPVTKTATATFAELANAWSADAAVDNKFTAGANLTASATGVLAAGSLGSISTDFRDVADNSVPASVAIGRASDGTQVVPGDLIVDGEITITFPGGVGDVDGVAIAGVVGPCTGPVADVFTCPVTAAELGSPLAAAGISYTVGGGATPPATPEQTVTAALTLDAATDYVLSGFSGNLATIEHDNGLDVAALGSFEWVRFGAGGTESNFRIQLADSDEAAAVTEIRIAVAADGNGVTAANLVLPIGTDADTTARIQGSTVTFNSRALGAIAGETGNADIAVAIQYQDTEDLTGSPINRQLVNRSPASFVATPGLE